MIHRNDLPENSDDFVEIGGKKSKIKKRELIAYEAEYEISTKYMRPDLQIPDS